MSPSDLVVLREVATARKRTRADVIRVLLVEERDRLEAARGEAPGSGTGVDRR
jgi:hypothetical protein